MPFITNAQATTAPGVAVMPSGIVALTWGNKNDSALIMSLYNPQTNMFSGQLASPELNISESPTLATWNNVLYFAVMNVNSNDLLWGITDLVTYPRFAQDDTTAPVIPITDLGDGPKFFPNGDSLGVIYKNTTSVAALASIDMSEYPLFNLPDGIISSSPTNYSEAWTNLSNGQGHSLNIPCTASPSVTVVYNAITDTNVYLMSLLEQGSTPFAVSIYTSPDGVTWTKDASFPAVSSYGATATTQYNGTIYVFWMDSQSLGMNYSTWDTTNVSPTNSNKWSAAMTVPGIQSGTPADPIQASAASGSTGIFLAYTDLSTNNVGIANVPTMPTQPMS